LIPVNGNAIKAPARVTRYRNLSRRPKFYRCKLAIATVGRPTAGALAMTILRWALLFFLVSIVAGLLGFTGISEASADIARFLFYVFVVIFLVLLILGLTIFRI
jgi:uncharacterized membrane protein YtjA (UPF0391 family)